MPEKKPYFIENIYQGGYSSFEPTPLSGYINTGTLGITTDPRSANVLQEVSSKLSAGVKHVEVEAITPDFFDSVPKQQLKEVQRLSKLTGVDVSVHGPVMDVTGLDPRRGGFSEAERELAEKKVFQTLERSHEINPDGNIPVNFHSAEGLPGSQFGPKKTPEGERIYKRIIAVNRESGRLVPLEEEKRFHPGGKVKEEILDPRRRLDVLNETEWNNSLFQVEVNRENAERILKDVHPIFTAQYVNLLKKAYTGQDISQEQQAFSKEEEAEINKVRSAHTFIKQAKMSADALFSKAYEFAKEDGDKRKTELLTKLSERYGEKVGLKDGKVANPDRYFNPDIHSEALGELVDFLDHASPRSNVPVEEFALKKSSQTFGNAAFEAYKKFGNKAPILTIENPPAGFALSTGEDLKNLIEASRKQFVEKAVKEGISESDAKETSKKLIGATWDVGHINMLRKYGYSEEDIIKESEKIAPFLKHVHLSDNFGFEHTELPMGMGNVPLKKIMEKLGQKGFDARKIIEAGQWWTHFKTSPVYPSLELIGSPVSSTRVSPFWNQTLGFHQDYPGGFGLMLPSINYETFGAGFSRLPSELGGQMPGARGSRMSGTPME